MRQIKLRMEQMISEDHFSLDEAHVLSYVARYGPCPVGEVCRVIGQKPTTLSSMLQRLERHEFLTRTLNSEDKRSLLLTITPTGSQAAERLGRHCDLLEEEILSGISEEDFKAFQKILGQIDKVTNIQVRESSQSTSPKRTKIP